MKKENRPRALICPLDWGLGHASRCVPVAHAMQEGGFDVAVACSGLQAQILHKELPQITLFPLPGFGIRYSRWLPLMAGLMLRIPLYLLRYLKARNSFLQLAERFKPSVVISDNRPECHWDKAFNIYITHQLSVHLWDLGTLERLFSCIHASSARPFQEIWVPDVPDVPGLSGKMGHPRRRLFRQPLVYVGFLSRFKPTPLSSTPIYDACFVLSGPEPARSRWEQKIIEQGKAFPEKKFVLIRGSTRHIAGKLPDNFFCKDWAASEDIMAFWAQSKRLVCRSGYSTLMDLCAAGRFAWIVPTPGQTEQEYLADLHRNTGLFVPVQEKDFSVRGVLEADLLPSEPCLHESSLLLQAVSALPSKTRGHE